MLNIRRRAAAADPETLTREDLRRLGKSERKLASPDASQAAAGRREIQDLERRHAQRIEGQSLAARLAETSSLALSRGEEVRSETVRTAEPMLDEHGARVVKDGAPLYRRETVTRVRIASRGGLQLAFDRGDLDGGPSKGERLLDAGRSYRWAFEAATGLTTPERNLSPISSRSPLRASAGPQDRVFVAGEMLRTCRAALTPRQCSVLDRVCGLDMTIRATALALGADPRSIRKALVEGLTRAAAARAAAGAPSPAE